MPEEFEYGSFDEQFAKGVELFNEKEFFECHDVFEELWQYDRSEMRLFLQGLIQAAVGCYHLSNGNTTGAISQYTKSLDKLRQYSDDYAGLKVAVLRTELERCLGGAVTMHEAGKRFEVAQEYFPVIEVIE